MLRRAHAERVATVGLVRIGLRRDRHVHVLIACPQTATMLVLLDPRDIDEKRNGRHVVEL